ncbi:PD-(D/E)XK nuclease family protein [Microvirga sp. STS02]|uniref:PD-(D/E)XK nuclease family protein n=1 Tax=Hymenobacter negativus TaxID=2795026 RepID=UPI0018DC6FF9|nr:MULTISPECIES: PD-(D/E)XK nuclease family protein [Bacteria]MBH8571181.1 PD-(D/E)XK nuclease family protein [Hymenobacter negativus]MBR7210918.1 PD-(D/E)XK nuclease family protein [Microvirga sp. STS02]
MPAPPAPYPIAAPATPGAAPVSFLAATARDLLDRYGSGPLDELSDIVVIVPTRRAVVYLKNELALALPGGAPLWAPRVAAMEDYMVELAGVQVEEPIALQLLLYDILKGIDTGLDFDKFVGWAGLLLSDFSNLDQNLADTHKVFEYLSEAKALERWDLAELPPKSQAAAHSFSFWNQLERVYHELQRRMKANHLAYPGLAYRLAVQKLEKALRDPAKPEPAKHVFVGLGNLSKSEEKLIRLLLNAGRAEIRFDADPFYLEKNSPNRAGQHLRRYFEQWKLPLDNFGGGVEYLRSQAHHVRYLGVANPSMQGKLAGQLLAEARQRYPDATVAVVLPDETLLLPVLHGLPPDEVPDYNVTMGLSFQATPLFNLVDLLFEVHLTGIREGSQETGYGVPRYHHLAVSKLLSHPFLRRYQHWQDQQADQPQYHGILDQVCREIVRLNAVLLPAEELLKLGAHHPLIEALFKTWDNCDDIIAACYTVIDLLRQVYAAEVADTDREASLGSEYLYLFYTLVKQLDSAFDCREQRLSVRSFRRFLYEQMGRTRLPFSGEPLADVQVMGLLETRALDFDHLIILSCNEGVLPAPKRQQSLFPYDVLTTANLPTYADAEAITAYNFWRLLQRAQRVDLVHVLPGAEGMKSGERSRFLLQLQNDLLPQNPQLTLEDLTVSVAGPEVEVGVNPYEGDLILEKDSEMLAALRGVLERNISPSRLNDFLACSLRFYFSKVARFHENEAVEETLEASSFGTMIHEALENLMLPFEQDARPITAADIPELIRQAPAEVQRALRQEASEKHARADEGLNHVYGQVATRLVVRLLESLTEQPGLLPLRLFGLEKELAATVFVDVPGQPEQLAVRLFGFADRVDELPDGRLRVVDYKSGLVKKSDLQLRGYRNKLSPAEAVDRLLHEPSSSADKVRQLWLYRLMLAHTVQRETADTSILSLRNIDEGLLSADLSFLTDGGEDFVAVSEDLVRKIALRILDPTEPIRKTDDFTKCEYCPYKGICAR